jgi:hypothetical protein
MSYPTTSLSTSTERAEVAGIYEEGRRRDEGKSKMLLLAGLIKRKKKGGK